MPGRHEFVRSEGLSTTDAERALLREHRIEVVVCRDSGGDLTAAKLVAARELGLPVVMVDRPPAPAGVTTVATVEEAVDWLRSSALTPTSRTGRPGRKRSSTSSAAASSVSASDVGSGSVMLRVFVVKGANRTLTPTRAAGLPSMG